MANIEIKYPKPIVINRVNYIQDKIIQMESTNAQLTIGAQFRHNLIGNINVLD